MKLLFLSFLLVILSTQSIHLRTTRHIDKKYQPKLIMQSNTICYGVMFDAGSSGTRVYVYQWNCRETQTMSYINVNEDAPAKKIKPGISTFADNINGLNDYFQQFINFANEYVPLKMRQYTPIMLGATAGMRLLPQDKQDLIIQEIITIFQKTDYLILNKQWIRVINGQEEGAYLWLSINYLLQNLGPSSQQTAVTIDLGGASTQIAFKVEEKIEENDMDLVIPNYNQYQLYSISHLYYGSDQAQIKVNQLINNQSNPCYFLGYTLDNLIGTGNINECRAFIRKYINNDPKNCKFTNCGINGEYQPEIAGNLIYGVSGINSVAELFKLKRFTLDELYIQCVKFCSLQWEQVMENEEFRNNPYISTDFFMVLYVYELLQYGYGIKETQIIESPELINDISPTWTLAAMFYQVGQIDCHNDSPVCSSLIYVV